MSDEDVMGKVSKSPQFDGVVAAVSKDTGIDRATVAKVVLSYGKQMSKPMGAMVHAYTESFRKRFPKMTRSVLQPIVEEVMRENAEDITDYAS